MATIASLMVKLGADITDLNKKMNDAQKLVSQTADGMTKAGKIMTLGVTLPILAAGAAAFKMASDYNESLNKVEVAFGYAAGSIESWSETTLKSFGIAKGTALDMAASYGDMATSMGLSKSAAADMSKQMVSLAGDMASFKNMDIAEVNTALTAVFTGETESLKRMGIVMTEANLQSFAMSQGIKENVKDMTQAEQVQLRYNYVLANTKNAQGDFARTGGGAANQMRIFTESVKEVGANIGQVLIPIITPAIKQFNQWIQAFGELNPEAQKTVLIIAGITAAAGPLMFIVGGAVKTFMAVSTGVTAVKGAVGAATAAQWGWNAALTANPIGLVIAGVVGLIAILGVLSYALNKDARDWKKATEEMVANIKAQGEADRTQIDKSVGEHQKAIEDKTTAEAEYYAANMEANQKAYEAEIKAGQKSLDAKKKDLSERQQLLDDNYNKAIEKIRAEYGVFDISEKTKTEIVQEETAKRIDELNKELDAAVSSHDKAIEAINKEYGVYEKVQKSKLDLIEEEAEAFKKSKEEKLSAAEKEYDKAIQQLRDEYGVYEETQKSMVDIAKETAAAKIKELNDEYDTAKKNADKAKDDIESAYKREVEAAQKAHDEKSRLLDAEYAQKMKIIDLGLSDEVKALRDKIDAIDNMTAQEEKALKEAENNKKILSLQSSIAAETDAGKRADLQQELQDFMADLERERLLESRELEKKALEDQITAAQTAAEEKKKALETELADKQTALDTELQTELDNLQTAKEAAITAENDKLVALQNRIASETESINAALETELTSINNTRKEKEAAELAKYEAAKKSINDEIAAYDTAAQAKKDQNEAERLAKIAVEDEKLKKVKETTAQEITDVTNKSKEVITKIQEERLAKETAETAKYTAAKKSLDDESEYLNNWITDTYTPALDAKLKAANEKEDERHKKIMADLADEAAKVEETRSNLIVLQGQNEKLQTLNAQISGKQKELDALSPISFNYFYNSAKLQNEINALKKERDDLMRTVTGEAPRGQSSVNGAFGGGSGHSFAVGTPYVPYDMVANIHKGEAIIPAAENRRNSSGISAKTATIIIELDGRIIGRAVGQPLADEIRVRTGIKI